MSDSADRRSSVSSVSLIEIKTETHRVLQAFLERTISTPHKERPGRIAGAYDDHNKHSLTPHSKQKDEHDSRLEKEDEKKPRIKDRMKSFPRTSIILGKGSLGRSSKAKQSHLTEDNVSQSSSSDEEDQEKRKKEKIKKRIASFFKKKIKEKKEKEEQEKRPPQRLSDLTVDKKATQDLVSPETDEPTDFYDDIAQKLEHIAKRSSTRKRPSPKLIRPTACDKEVVVEQLVKLLSSEGDAMNTKIQQQPELCSRLSRLSYRSFENVLDIFGRSQITEAPPLKPSTSPTLQRIAVSMEASRRIVTATGTQRMEGFAERYMDKFVPWIKNHGGWGNVLDVEWTEEWD